MNKFSVSKKGSKIKIRDHKKVDKYLEVVVSVEVEVLLIVEVVEGDVVLVVEVVVDVEVVVVSSGVRLVEKPAGTVVSS